MNRLVTTVATAALLTAGGAYAQTAQGSDAQRNTPPAHTDQNIRQDPTQRHSGEALPRANSTTKLNSQSGAYPSPSTSGSAGAGANSTGTSAPSYDPTQRHNNGALAPNRSGDLDTNSPAGSNPVTPPTNPQ